MADLRELEQFERDLKNLVHNRNPYQQQDYSQPSYFQQNYFQSDYAEINNPGQLLPKQKPKPEPNIMTFMMAEEHGQPFKRPEMLTYMMVGEHGQPYRQNRPNQPNQKMLTRMGIREHGQPYKPNEQLSRVSTNMAVREHGQPYRPNEQISMVSTNMAVREHGQPYRPKNQDESDYINRQIRKKFDQIEQSCLNDNYGPNDLWSSRRSNDSGVKHPVMQSITERSENPMGLGPLRNKKSTQNHFQRDDLDNSDEMMEREQPFNGFDDLMSTNMIVEEKKQPFYMINGAKLTNSQSNSSGRGFLDNFFGSNDDNK